MRKTLQNMRAEYLRSLLLIILYNEVTAPCKYGLYFCRGIVAEENDPYNVLCRELYRNKILGNNSIFYWWPPYSDTNNRFYNLWFALLRLATIQRTLNKMF